ncbi:MULTISPECIES: MBL fold metallo-hydrolase [Deefgea]|uniref:MBL fold metallo-hydrolase n=1 Tax=Deefgea chitinilytica TaxID=570276 RepID=A0ABS2CE42_9NEIS|nr:MULTISPECIES: MBL fold metallo-hydrolase [Deefgea]MBM5572415.1 MBL fold metallo-hydrolase [Deefgea chitinilytica]MBM9889651.1 MBL fold metallo-hydrolase [Deefgea sp. CFH1-16]
MFRTTLLAATLALTFANAQAETAKQPLQMKVYNADGNSFHANSTLIYGEKEAIVIDAGFTRADALRIGANVLDSGKELKTIFVSQADPDYYFGVEVLKQMFPNAEVVATPAVLAKISSKLDGKVAFWGPKMGANAPKKPVLPAALKGETLTVDGEKIEIRGTKGPLAHRPYVWIPSTKTITGNIGVFGGLHVWTADTQNAAERTLWIAQLDDMAALKPEVIVPGHMQAGSKLDVSNIAYTKQYLQTFEKNAAAAKNSAELIASMKKAYPDAGLGMALEIGAKVNKGEMKW